MSQYYKMALTFPINAVDRLQLYRIYVVILIHSIKCIFVDQLYYEECFLSQCLNIKKEFEHIKNCRIADNCPVLHCTMTRRCLRHWEKCYNWDCIICDTARKSLARDGTLSIFQNHKKPEDKWTIADFRMYNKGKFAWGNDHISKAEKERQRKLVIFELCLEQSANSRVTTFPKMMKHFPKSFN